MSATSEDSIRQMCFCFAVKYLITQCWSILWTAWQMNNIQITISCTDHFYNHGFVSQLVQCANRERWVEGWEEHQSEAKSVIPECSSFTTCNQLSLTHILYINWLFLSSVYFRSDSVSKWPLWFLLIQPETCFYTFFVSTTKTPWTNNSYCFPADCS